LYPLCHIKRDKINKKIHFVPTLSLFKRQNEQNEQNDSFRTPSVTLQRQNEQNEQKDSFCTPSVTFQGTK